MDMNQQTNYESIQPVASQQTNAFYTQTDVPVEYKPISAWGYVGYNILFYLPVIGWIFALVMAVTAKNKNVKNYAVSYWLYVLISVVITVIGFLILMAMGITFSELMNSSYHY